MNKKAKIRRLVNFHTRQHMLCIRNNAGHVSMRDAKPRAVVKALWFDDISYGFKKTQKPKIRNGIVKFRMLDIELSPENSWTVHGETYTHRTIVVGENKTGIYRRARSLGYHRESKFTKVRVIKPEDVSKEKGNWLNWRNSHYPLNIDGWLIGYHLECATCKGYGTVMDVGMPECSQCDGKGTSDFVVEVENKG